MMRIINRFSSPSIIHALEVNEHNAVRYASRIARKRHIYPGEYY
jgi:hypothetical protein